MDEGRYAQPPDGQSHTYVNGHLLWHRCAGTLIDFLLSDFCRVCSLPGGYIVSGCISQAPGALAYHLKILLRHSLSMPSDSLENKDSRSTATDKQPAKSWAETNCLVDLVKTTVNAALIDPARGVAQAIDHEKHSKFEQKIDSLAANLGLAKAEPAKSGPNWYAEQLGNAAGMMLPLMLLRGSGGAIVKRLAIAEKVAETGAVESRLFSHQMFKAAGKEAFASGLSGLAYGTVFRTADDADSKTSFWQKRLKNGVSDMTTFGLLGATNPFAAKALDSLASTIEHTTLPEGGKLLTGLKNADFRVPGTEQTAGAVIRDTALPFVQRSAAYSLRMPVISGALSGIPGGALNAEIQARQDGRFLPTADELKQNIESMAFVGSAFGGSHALLARVGAKPVEQQQQSQKQTLPENHPSENHPTENSHLTTPEKETPKFKTPEAAISAFKNLVAENNWKDARALIDASAVDRSIVQDPVIHDAALSAFQTALGKNNWKDINEIVNTGALAPEEFKTEAAQKSAQKQLSVYLGEFMLDHVKAVLDSNILDGDAYRDPGIRKATVWALEHTIGNKKLDRFNIVAQLPWVNAEILKESAGAAVQTSYNSYNWASDASRANTLQHVQALGLLQRNEVNDFALAGTLKAVASPFTSLNELPKTAQELLGKDWHQDPAMQAAALSRVEGLLASGKTKELSSLQDLGLISKDLLTTEHMHQLALKGLPSILNEDSEQATKDLENLSKAGIKFSEAEVRPIGLTNLEHLIYHGDLSSHLKLLKTNFNLEYTYDETRSIAGSTVSSVLSHWDRTEAQQIIDTFHLTPEDVQDAAAGAMPIAIRGGRIPIANALKQLYEISPEAEDKALQQAIANNDITNTLRTVMYSRDGLDSALEKYLGITELNDATAKTLFEKLKASDPEWEHVENVQKPFNEGAQIFGEEKMLRFALNASASPHDALHAFGDIIKLYQKSAMTPDAFYGKILSQVSRETTIDDEGSAYTKLNKIAKSFPEDTDAILAKGREHQDISRLQELVKSFENKESIFTDWEHLQRFNKLQWMVESTELLPELKELKASGNTQLAEWIESLAFHPDSRISIQTVRQFWKNPEKFLALDDANSGDAHGYKKPSNYTDIAHLDMTPVELRDALVSGALDRIQVFKPMKIEYNLMPNIDLGSEFNTALGSRKEQRAGSAKNVPKLFSEVSKLLKTSDEKFTVQDLVAGKAPPESLEQPLQQLLYNANFGVKAPEVAMKMIAEIHRKSDPLAVLAGDDTACCMGFGTGKNNIYMFNPNDSQFTVRLVRADGTSRTIAQSVLTKDKDIKASVPDVMEKMNGNDATAAHALIPDEAMRDEKAIIAADNIEVHPNYKGGKYPSALESVYRDFFNRYLNENGANQNLRTDKIVIGLGYSDIMSALPQEANTYVPQAPAAYSDKTHATVYTLSMDRPQKLVAEPTSITVPEQAKKESQQTTTVEGVTPLTFEDSLSAAYLESKAYQDNENLVHGIHNMENSLIAQSINNEIKGRPNLSMKYTDSKGVTKGYIVAYEGKLEQNGINRPIVFVSDYSSDRRIGLDGSPKAGRAGGKLLQAFMEQYKKNYLDKGELIPVFVNAREETSYKLLMKNINAISKTLGYKFDIKETGTEQVGQSTMHDLLMVPRAR